jgi:hypothetical protein
MSRRTKALAVAVAALGTALAGVLAGAAFTGSESAGQERMRELRMLLKGAAAPGRVERFAQSLQGHGLEKGREASRSEIVEGPAQEDYANRAYPATRIAFAQQQQSLRAAKRLLTKKKSGGGWHAIGPDTLDVDTFGTQTYGVDTQWSGRVTAAAVGACDAKKCKLYVGAAGGGVWMTTNALKKKPKWKNISDGQIDSTSIGSILVDPTDPTHQTVYVGTGEPNGSGDSEAGIGLYRSTDGGQTWTLLTGSQDVAKDRGIGAIAVDPNDSQHLLIGTTVARHGLSSNSGGRFTPPDPPDVGLYESTDGGANWSLAFSQPGDSVDPTTSNGSDFFRGGVTKIEYDPNDPSTYYFSMFGYGLFRHNGSGFENVFADTVSATDAFSIRYEFATADLPNGKTRIYLGAGYNEGDSTFGASRLFRVDDASASAASLTTGGTNGGWTDLSSDNDTDPGFGSFDFCQAQCSYDMFVASPPGRPDEVVLGGSMQYGELPIYSGADISNGRAVVQSTDAGVSWTDLTGDATKRKGGLTFNFEDMHPDQHAIAFDPANPDIMFVGSDGGMIRTDGTYKNNSGDCLSAQRGLSGQDLANCQQFLSRIPTKLMTMNEGLNTLQFQSLSVDPHKPTKVALGGTQDNGTLAYSGSDEWFLGITGDGGDSGIDAVNGSIRFHSYTNTFTDTNFHGVNPTTWVWTGDTMLFSGEASAFYAPMLQDPVTGGQIFAGMEHVWRTQDSGGSQAFLEAHCNTTGAFGTSDELFTGNCGDYEPLGTALNDTSFGADKLGNGTGGDGDLAALARGMDTGTLWAATRLGRVFISMNADAANPASVDFFRIDTSSQPTRFPSGIAVDPTDPNHAIITYSSYNAYATDAGTATGHVFDVVVDPNSCSGTTCSATWTSLDNDIGDQPVLDVAFDQVTGDVYVSTDFGVFRLPQGQTSWVPAATGLPPVAVYGLTLVDDKKGVRQLYAATHGRGAYRLTLPKP